MLVEKGSSISARGTHDVIAIGASAGGFRAVEEVLAGLPRDLPAAVLIVQHLQPDRDSGLPGLLARHCALPVHAASDGAPILPGHVYIGVPDAHLVAKHDHLTLGDSAAVRFSRPSVDVLFQSVALAYGARAVAVVLTGAGSDGAAGVRAIHDAGGTVIAQDAHEAAYGSMPSHAFATGCVDDVLLLRDIAPAIVRLVNGTSDVGADSA
jgi:two-component system chemotaxis response regulator CheB